MHNSSEQSLADIEVGAFPMLNNQDSLELAEAYRSYDAEALQSWLECDDPIVRRNRMQAMQSYPAITLHLHRKIRFPLSKDRNTQMAVEALIDSGGPFVNGVASLANVRRGSVRLLRGRKPTNCHIGTNICSYLQLLDAISHGSQPRTEQQWRLFNKAFSVLPFDWPMEMRCWPTPGNLGIHLMAGLMTAGPSRISKIAGMEFEGLEGIYDYAKFVERWCVAGAGLIAVVGGAMESVYGSNRNALLARYSAMEIVGQSLLWQKMISQIDRSSGTTDWDQLPQRGTSYCAECPTVTGEPFGRPTNDDRIGEGPTVLTTAQHTSIIMHVLPDYDDATSWLRERLERDREWVLTNPK